MKRTALDVTAIAEPPPPALPRAIAIFVRAASAAWFEPVIPVKVRA